MNFSTTIIALLFYVNRVHQDFAAFKVAVYGFKDLAYPPSHRDRIPKPILKFALFTNLMATIATTCKAADILSLRDICTVDEV